MNRIHTVLLSAVMSLAVAQTANAQDAKKFNGFWTGSYTCSDNLVATAKSRDAYTANIVFTVENNKSTTRKENSNTLEIFDLTISGAAAVAIESKGSWVKEPNRTWSIRANGNIVGNKLKAEGGMYGSDGAKVREKCTFLLSNAEMEFQAAADKATKETAPVAVAPPVAAVAVAAAPKPATPKPVSTPAPVAVAATSTTPARTAAIANVTPAQVAAYPVAAAAPVDPAAQFKKVTANPIDAQKKTHPNDVWINFNPAITVQERQFCRIVENFRTEYAVAESTHNQIKSNETLRGLAQSLNSLLPDGKFPGWVMRVVNVAQAKDGSAEVLLELPCNVYVGSNACDPDPKNFYGTAPEGSRIYTELAKMTVGDFALVSGQFMYADDKAFSKDRSVASFKYMKAADHCKAKTLTAKADFFGLKLEVLSTIK
jgi:hypothetical protein